MYVQFQVIVKANSQEKKGHMRMFVPKKQRKADIGSFRTNAMLKIFSKILIGFSIQTNCYDILIGGHKPCVRTISSHG